MLRDPGHCDFTIMSLSLTGLSAAQKKGVAKAVSCLSWGVVLLFIVLYQLILMLPVDGCCSSVVSVQRLTCLWFSDILCFRPQAHREGSSPSYCYSWLGGSNTKWELSPCLSLPPSLPLTFPPSLPLFGFLLLSGLTLQRERVTRLKIKLVTAHGI